MRRAITFATLAVTAIVWAGIGGCSDNTTGTPVRLDSSPQADGSTGKSDGSPPQHDGNASDVLSPSDGGNDKRSGGDAANTAMSFFVTSVGLGDGGNLGGLTGADKHCSDLATAAGASRTQWVAYLSVASGPGGNPVNARDRIGTGPWYNVNGAVLANNLAELHPTVDPAQDRAGYIAVKPKDEALYWDETGTKVPGNEHDILTGTQADGSVMVGFTCQDWTSNANGDKAQVGHSDTPGSEQFSPSWNSAHDTVGCSQTPGVSQRGGSGRFYCFATD